MAKFLTTRGTTSKIEYIINHAKRHVVLISPFVKIPETLFQCIQGVDKNNVKISIVFGKKDLEPEVKGQLGTLKNLKLYYLENLHAKCFFNEDTLVITSLNLYDFSEHSNREMGVLLTQKDDEIAFKEAIEEANRIINLADNLLKTQNDSKGSLSGRTASSRKKSEGTGLNGYCIRCDSKIPFNPDKPYCPTCFKEWSQWENPDYEEEYCHKCGKHKVTTIERPLCNACYRKLQI